MGDRNLNQPLLGGDTPHSRLMDFYDPELNLSHHFDRSETPVWLTGEKQSPVPSPSHSSLRAESSALPNLPKTRIVKRSSASHARARKLPWICIDEEGKRTFIHADKRALIATACINIPIRDMRLLDYQLVQSDTTILVRDNAMIVCMEHVRCIVTANRAIIPREGAEQNPLTARFVDVLEESIVEWMRQKKEFQRQEEEAAVAADFRDSGFGRSTPPPLNTASMTPIKELPNSIKNSAGTVAGGLASTPTAAASAAAAMNEAASDVEEGSSMSHVRLELQPLPFELVVLEAALKEVVACISMQVKELEGIALPALDALTRGVTSTNLERVRKVKTREQRLNLRCEALRDELQRFLQDDDDMSRMCLTRRKEMEESAKAAAGLGVPNDDDAGLAVAYSPPSHPFVPGSLSRRSSLALARASMTRTPTSPTRSTSLLPSREALLSMGGMAAAAVEEEADAEAQQEVENLLESYYMEVDHLYDKLVSVGEYTKDTEEYINIELDSSRNRLIRMDIILSVAAFAIMPFNLIAGILGENLIIPKQITGSVFQFYSVNALACCFCATLFYVLLLYMRYSKLI